MQVNKRLALLAARELEKRNESSKMIIDDSFAQQASFVRDPSRFVAAGCTRRAGKSNGLGFKFWNKARKYPGVMLPYVSLTRESAKNIMWPVLWEQNEKFKLGAEFTESNLTVTLPNRSRIQLFGADMKNFINRLKGIKTPFAGIDEGQAFRSHIEQLVDEVLGPATADYIDGQIALTGTPGPVPKGYFYEATQGKQGFSVHGWTLYDNPYMPNAKTFVEELIKKKNWKRDNPTLRREYFNEWVADLDALVYRFDQDKGYVDDIPNEEWFYVLGVDLGYSPDPSAFVLCAYSHFDRHMYVIDVHEEEKLDVSGVANKIKEYLKLFPTAQVVADLGAQGKMIGEEIRKRHAIPLIAATKTAKSEFIEIMNSDFQQGLIKLLRGQADALGDEYLNLIWDPEKDKKVEDARYPNHKADATLYAWRHCYNFAAGKRPEKLNPEEELQEFWDREAEKLNQSKDEEKDLYG